MSRKTAMDRKAREYHNSIPKKVEEEMCEIFGYSPEEYKEIKKKWDEDKKKRHKRFKNEMAQVHAHFEDEKIQRESDNRRELITKGILKYVKNIGLVNTETGQVIKL